MRSYSITRYDWNGFRDVLTRVGSVVACSTGHALETAIRTWGKAHYTALELPATPYCQDEPIGAWYSWHTTHVGKTCLYSPYHVSL